MKAFEDALGFSATDSQMLQRFIGLSTAQCPAIELTECELNALRKLGSGGSIGAECTDVCNSDNETNIVPTECSGQSDLPRNLWANDDFAFESFEERACGLCSIGIDESSSGGLVVIFGISGGVLFIIILTVTVVCCFRRNKQTDRGDTAYPMADQPRTATAPAFDRPPPAYNPEWAP